MAHILYGTQASLFSGKVRAYLDWRGVDYREERPDPEFIVVNVGRMVIPVMKLEDGTVLQDSTVIIDHFENSESVVSVYPDTPRQKLAALLLETFGDEWLVIPAMHYRWNYNEEWIYGEFGRNMLPDGSPEEQIAAGKAIGERFKAFTPMLGVNAESIPGIEKSYEALLANLDMHFSQHRFLLGSRPSIGDYGLIGPLYAHLYRDPASGEIMKRLAPEVARWIERMVEPERSGKGEYLAHDVVPDTLLPVLRRMMREQLPNLAQTAKLMAEWGASTDDVELPRAVGQAEYVVEGHRTERFAAPFSLWMLQRATDFLASLDSQDREACASLLRDVDGDSLLDFEMPFRLKFENHRLYRE
ncbi:glutathione S-transferase family protein [Altererythrobacter sp. MF3-039]|uniref:glutathione S-transferase family protein n=1 Tax=Altererythrobacter sp. MF3-039 TaxID=3252901 RepID=UPI00390C88F8